MVAEAGQPAPEFELPATGGRTIRLNDYIGKSVVVLYFYPKDMTPGCTDEACNFNLQLKELKRLGAVVLGISPDSVAMHEKFARAQNLDFPLLADENHSVIERYGVWGEKNLYGRKSMGVIRSTFLIDKDGRIARAWRGVKVPGHTDVVVQAVGELAGVPHS